MMNCVKVKVLGADGFTLASSTAGERAGLFYPAAYRSGEKIAVECAHVPCWCMLQLDESMPETMVYLNRTECWFPIPMEEEKCVYSPKSFLGDRHLIRARLASEEEILARKNLALNPYDRHGESGIYPHARANVETRNESVFAARNAIDGVLENAGHGAWPYQSWGINRDPNACLTLEFGRLVEIDEIVLTLRADFPHDSWWEQVTVRFSDGSEECLNLEKSDAPQRFSITPRTVKQLELCRLIESKDDPSPYPALVQIQVYGKETFEK